jgi:hypothetical protein
MTDDTDPPVDLILRAIAMGLPDASETDSHPPDSRKPDGGPPTVARREPSRDTTLPKARKPGEPRRPPTKRELAIRADIARYEAAMPTPCGARCGRWVARNLTTLYMGRRICPACLEAALIAEREAVRLMERRRTLAARAWKWAEMEQVAKQNTPEIVP